MFAIILIVILGACVGSFVNVLASRVVAGQSIILPASFCDACVRPLLRRDLIPVVSFFILKTRCRFCRAKLSWQYPLVEFATAVLFLIFYFKFPEFGWQLASAWIAAAALVTLFLTDLRAMVLPDQITIPAIVTLAAIDIFLLNDNLKSLGLALLLGGGFFLIQYIVSSGKWIGSGDIRMGLLMAIMLRDWQSVVAAIFLSYLIGSVVSVLLLILKKKKMTSEIPLGVFLVIGALTVMIFGVDFFMDMLGF